MVTPAEPASRDVWERWLTAWHLVFVASLVLTTLGAFIEGDLTGATLAATTGLLAVLAVGYTLVFVVHRPWSTGTRTAVVYLVVIGLAFAGLLRCSESFFWLQPIMFSQVFWLLETRRAIPVVVFYMAIVLQYAAQLSGDPLEEQLPGLIGPAFSLVFFVVLGAWISAIIRQSDERRELIERLDATRRELAERERATGVLEERERLSRELHDTLAQDLVGIVTHLQAADATTDAAAAAEHRSAAARMAHEGLAETRRLVWALRPAELEGATLVESLARTVERWGGASGVRAVLTVTGEPQTLSPDVEVALLRSAQEGLANAARHAAPREVTVSLSYLGDLVTLDVHDDGAGFDPSPPTPVTPGIPGQGLGLRGMRERVERLGGHVAIESQPGEGTTVAVSLPVTTP